MAVVVMLEALAYGLGRLTEAARDRGVEPVLLTFDRDYYRRQSGTGAGLRVVDVDTFDTDAVRAALDGLGDVRGLISNTDTWAPAAELLAAERGFAGVVRNTSRLRDKVWVRNRVADAGLSALRAVRGSQWPAVAASAARSALYVVKDAQGTGSRHVRLADRAHSVADAVAALGARGVPADRITVEPYVCGPLYSAETYTTEDGTVLLGVNSRTVSELPHFRELDLSFPVRRGSGWERAVADWAAGLLACVGRGTGFSHIEFVDTADGPELVEVNARLGGGLIGEAVLRAGGVDPYRLLVAQATQPRVDASDLAACRREPAVGGFAQVLKYAARTGKLGDVAGTEDVPLFPGDVAWHPQRDATSLIESVEDQQACYGVVTATGPSPETALHRAHAAARHLRAGDVAPDGGPR